MLTADCRRSRLSASVDGRTTYAHLERDRRFTVRAYAAPMFGRLPERSGIAPATALTQLPRIPVELMLSDVGANYLRHQAQR